MYLKNKNPTYGEAIFQAIYEEMSANKDVFVLGQGVDDPKGTLGTTLNLHKIFGKARSFDTPIAEESTLGIAIGAALAGKRPINVHIRVDFLLLCMNQLINMGAKMHYMFGGSVNVPIVLKASIGRSWGQGAQHSQAFQSFFMHTPGLKLVMPTFPIDAKDTMKTAIKDNNPVVYLEHRMLYNIKGFENLKKIKKYHSRIVKKGKHVTVVAISYMVIEALRAQKHLKEKKIDIEIIDPVWLSPLDINTILKSVKKTKKLVVIDNAWLTCGVSAEIITKVLENLNNINIEVERMGFLNVPCPTTKNLENAFYPNSFSIASKIYSMINKKKYWQPKGKEADEISKFKGPF